MRQRQRDAATRQSRADPTHVPAIEFSIDLNSAFNVRLFVNNPLKHALLQHVETSGPDAPPPLDYAGGVNHIYRHRGIAVILHLHPKYPECMIDVLKDIVEDVQENREDNAAEKRLLSLTEHLGTRTPRRSTLNAIRAVIMRALGLARNTEKEA